MPLDQSNPQKEIRTIAKEYLLLHREMSKLEQELDIKKSLLRKEAEGQTFLFPEYDGKVVVGERTSTSAIDAPKLGKFLLDAGRFEEFCRTVTVEKRKLTEYLIDGDTLAKQFAIDGALREATVRAADLSAKDKKLLAESV